MQRGEPLIILDTEKLSPEHLGPSSLFREWAPTCWRCSPLGFAEVCISEAPSRGSDLVGFTWGQAPAFVTFLGLSGLGDECLVGLWLLI